jgi:perosamine synthetase
VKECLDTGWVSSVGAFVDRFEAMMAERAGCRHAVATASGTAALHVALIVAGVEAGDEVIVSALTFVAPANAIRYVGAHPVFVDADARFWQLDVDRLEEFLETRCERHPAGLRNRTTGRRVRAIVPVHVLGHPCDMDRITTLAGRFDLVVIEDASESLGAQYRGRPVGSLGDIACFSFNGSKVATSGGGGAITTNRESWASRARYLTTQAKDDPIEYVHHAIGFNYRLPNVNAAIGCAQLEQLDRFLARKREIAAVYARALSDRPAFGLHPAADWATPTYWLYTMTIDEPAAGISSREMLRRFADARITTRPLWHPIPQLPPYRDCESLGGAVATRLYRDALSLPSATTLAPDQQNRVIGVLLQALERTL